MMNATDTNSAIPIACRPAALTAEERERSARLRADVAAGVSKTTELADGYSFGLRGDAKVFQSAAEWITLERRCCPFLTFTLGWVPGDDATPTLSLTGPEGTKGFLAAEMPELPRTR